MSGIDIAPGVTVQVNPPNMPPIAMSPPASGVTVLVPVAGPQGPPGDAEALAQVTVTGTAAQALSGHRAVTRLPDGTIDYASNADPGHLHLPVWITTGAVASGGEVTATAYGYITEPAWSWTPGPIYLGVNGALTQIPPVAPAFLAQIGVATSPTQVFVDRSPSISLI